MEDRRLYLGPLTDNRRWDRINLRADDVIVATPPKCGTTWMQTITALLLSGDPEVETELSIKQPWIDIRLREIDEVAERVNGWTHRRSLKSHTPMDGLPYHPQVQYLCVFRHPLDAHFSFRKHIANMPFNPVGHFFLEGDDATTFRRFLDGGPEGHDGDAMPLAHIVRHYVAAKALSEQANVTLFHYADMSADLPATFAKVAQLLGVDLPVDVMDTLIAAATFDNMKANAERFAPSGGKGFLLSDAEFFHSGTSGKWTGKITDAELEAYDYTLSGLLDPKDRAWLEYGSQGGLTTGAD